MAQEVSELTKVALAVLPVLAGGLIGVCGTLGVNYLQHRQKKSETLEKKAEEALKYSYQSIIWLHEYRKQCLIDGEILNSSWPPLDVTEAIVSLYMPEAETEAHTFITKFSEAASVLADMGAEKLTKGKLPEDHKERWESSYEKLKPEFHSLKEKIREIAVS